MEVEALRCLEKSSSDGEKLRHQCHLRTTTLNAKGDTIYITFNTFISLIWAFQQSRMDHLKSSQVSAYNCISVQQ